ncbi:MAG: TatD family nuclease-associated radical SAM protein [Oscillospiraceae bacterium]|nr:TatD family nuclease-associated radical SAM protein [Oscillospiraceae bacterium]
MTITYRYKDNLYVNLTNRCPNRCEFCLRTTGDKVGDSGSLWLEREPTVDEIWASIESRDLSQYSQLVFCGYGEPTYRLDDLLEIARRVKKVSDIAIRVNTNGLSDLIHKKDTAPLFAGCIDSVSVSLNASTPEKYDALCHSIYGLEALPAILRFTKHIEQYVPYVRMTVVDTMSESELEACRRLCEQTGADFCVRHYTPDWQDPET